MQTTTDPPCTVLGGTLRRAGPDYWQWSDGTPAPEVYDLTVGSCHSFRCITYGCGTTYVQVPATLARSEPELRWIVEDRAAGSRRRTAAWNSHAPARGRGSSPLGVGDFADASNHPALG